MGYQGGDGDLKRREGVDAIQNELTRQTSGLKRLPWDENIVMWSNEVLGFGQMRPH